MERCNACPFSKKSLRGWLGPWAVNDLHRHVMAEGDFICHKKMDALGEEGVQYSEHYCAGSIEYMNKNAKMCKDPEKADLQKKHPAGDDIMSLPEFHKHHDPEEIRKAMLKDGR